MLTRGIDFGIVQTDVLDEIKRTPAVSRCGEVPAIHQQTLRPTGANPSWTGYPFDRRPKGQKGQFRPAGQRNVHDSDNCL